MKAGQWGRNDDCPTRNPDSFQSSSWFPSGHRRRPFSPEDIAEDEIVGAVVTVTEFVAHYHLERNHQGLDNTLIDSASTISGGHIQRQPRLGGLLNYYRRAA